MTAAIGLVLDGRDPEALADFWAEALGDVEVGRAGSHVLLVDPEGNELCVCDGGANG